MNKNLIPFKKGYTPWNKGKNTPSVGRKGRIPWNKELKGKGICKPNSGSFKNGEHRSIKTEFKKGEIRPSMFKKGEIRQSYWVGKKRPEISGENSFWWKGGITPENLKIRTSLEYKLWRKSVFERDNFTCQKTRIKGGKLHPHHINNFADFPELRTSIENGITLSEKVHREFHQLYGKKNNTKEQLLEFLSL